MNGFNFEVTREERELIALGQRLRRAQDAAARLENMTGSEAIAYALSVTIGTQGDLAAASGMTAATITAIKKGKRPNKGQQAALCWAIANKS